MNLQGERIASGPITDPVQLYIDVPKQGQPDSVVNLQWRLSDEAIQELKDKKAYDAQLLIVVSNNNTELQRKLVPLQPAEDYIWLKRPGDNIIHASVVWAGKFGHKPSTLMEMSRVNQDYYWRLVETRTPQVDAILRQKRQIGQQITDLEKQQSLKVWRQAKDLHKQLDGLDRQLSAAYKFPPVLMLLEEFGSGVSRLDFEAQISLKVPKEMFATNSWPITKWLGSRFWQSTPKDQCHLRRRALISGSTSMFWGPAAILATLCLEIGLVFTVLSLLVSIKKPKRFSFLHPWRHNPKYVWESSQPSWWWAKKKGSSYVPRHWLLQLINPPTLLLVSAVAFYCISLGVPVFFVLISLCGLVVGLLFGRYIAVPAVDKIEQRRQATVVVRQEREGAQLLANLQQLTATGSSTINPLYSRRHAYLKFQEVKAKICKPYAR